MRHISSLFLLLLGLSVSLQCWAQAPAEEQEKVRVKANTLTYEEQSNTVTATGDVVVTKGETTVTADTVGVNRATNVVTARGNVVVKDPQGEVEADTLRLEMEDETGELTNGTIRLPRNQYILTGKTLQKFYGQSYHIEDGAFTTCQCDDFRKADWSIGGKTIDVTLRGTGEVHDGVFRVRDIPIFYLPYGIVPLNNERQSGLLFPSYGFSSKRGFVWQQPFYWAISKSQDMTLTTDLETSARIGIWGEYRYAPNARTEGQFAASYFNEQIRGPATTSTPVDRWSLTGTHRQTLADDLRLYSDLFFVSDDLFLREINHRALSLASSDSTDFELRSRRFTDSHVGGVKAWANALLRTEASYYQDLEQNRDQGLEHNQDFAFQVLPRLQFQGRQRFWQDRLEAGLAIDGAHFYRNRGYAGQRLDFAPSVALPFHWGDYAFGAVQVVGRETAYHLTSEEPGQPALPQGNQLHGDRTREIVQFNARIGTRLSRVFDVSWGRLLKLQHVLEPEVAYLYVPFVGQDDLPLYDSLDRINKRNLFVYGISNQLLGKFATTPVTSGSEQSQPQTEVRELARLSVTHAYDPAHRLTRDQNHFSDVDVNARLTPLPYASFTFDSTYDVRKGDLITTRVGALVRDPRPLPPASPLLQNLQRSTTVGVSYRSTSDRLVKQFDPTSDIHPPDEIDTSIIFRLNEALTGAYIGRYDLHTSSFIGNRYFVRYFSPQHCWFVDFGVVDKVNPNEFEFRFMFNLVGLSSSGRPAF
ncbi:MAG TPA: LPS assembly protein LptD [Candidatus Binatia bacterium]|jgi:LPS-assembly protein|nr:LPS assembly protein LptD [Candidatus Binatia bacterium]